MELVDVYNDPEQFALRCCWILLWSETLNHLQNIYLFTDLFFHRAYQKYLKESAAWEAKMIS